MINKIRSVIIEQLGDDLTVDIWNVGEEDDLKMYGLDSINVVALIVGLEESFSIEFDLEDIDMEKFTSLAKIEEQVSYLSLQIKSQAEIDEL
jgi:acyl carrier protein